MTVSKALALALMMSWVLAVEEADMSEDPSACMALLQVTQERLKKPEVPPTPPPLLSSDPLPAHRVEHIHLLSETPFWWMMGVVIMLVTVVVVRTEVQQTTSNAAEEETFEAEQSKVEKPEKRLVNGECAGNAPTTDVKSLESPSEPPAGGRKAEEFTMYYSYESIQKLVFCFMALNMSMILWGIAQEFIMTNVYYDRDGQVRELPSALFLVLANRIFTMAFSAFLLWTREQPLLFPGCIDAVWPAVSNTCASWSQYSSLGYISFGLQTTAKSVKILPVVIISSLRGKYHSLTDYAECLVLACACFVFGHESESESDSLTTVAGVLLLLAFIVCDSVTPHLQDILFQKHKEIDVVQATFAMSSMAVVMMLIEMIVTLKLFDSFAFLWNCPEAMLHMLVLSLASTLTQYMISYTIKHFGPVVFTIIASTRQVISVLISAVLFSHHMSGVALVAMFIMFGTLMLRSVRPLAKDHNELLWVMPEDYQRIPLLSFSARLSVFSPLFICTTAIHVVYIIYTLLQEFLSTHTFDGHLFNFPLTLVAISHTAAALLSLAALRTQGHSIVTKGLWQTILPGSTDLVATSLQHSAIYKMYFPAQSLMKTLKVLPVMMIGTCLQNRTYSKLDYAEGFLLSCLVAFFVFDFQFKQLAWDPTKHMHHTSLMGVLMMLGYVVVDSFTSNFEDSIYQRLDLTPGHMLLGMETFSAALAWVWAAIMGEVSSGFQFVIATPGVLLFLSIFALTSAVGSLACVLTVRLFGPAVFTLIMTSRAILSLLISVMCFQHGVDSVDCISLVAVSIITLMSSARRVSAQMRQFQ